MAAHGGNPSRRRQRAPLLILLLVMLLGFGLRAHNLDAFSFWTDEGLTPERAGYPLAQILRNDIVIQGVVTKDTHPPLYYLILHATRPLFGATDFAFRYPSVLFGLLLVPLLYQLGRRMAGVTLGLLAALLAAANPLQVYYSQEARMYSLLVLLVTAMSYVLWRAMDQIRNTRYEIRDTKERTGYRISTLVSPAGGLIMYGVLAALALYTHYTVAFLIAAQGLLWAWVLWRAGLRRAILAAAAVGVVAAIPLVPYTLPRLTAGAEANYFAVSPLTMLADVVRFFNLGLTVDFAQPLVIALNVLALGLLLLGLWASARYEIRDTSYDERSQDLSLVTRHSSLVRPVFLLSWLLAVVLGLMAGSILFKPMYQGVRHIIAGSPAFLLLVAFGIWAIWRWLPPQPEARPGQELTGWTAWRAGRPAINPLALVPLILLLLGSAVALVNLYTDPAYVKDDFRAIVRFIETRAGDRDIIVYNNAVLLPLHEHYRQRADIAVTALPAYPQPATGAETELAALARDYDRVWFITDPPADHRDDGRLIQGWLDANLTETLNRLFPARTTVARVIAYSAAGGSPPPEPHDSASAAAQSSADQPCAPTPRHPCALSPLPDLAGVAFDSPLERPTLWVDLYWRGERPRANASLLFTLAGADGQEYYRHARPLLPDDDTRWDETADNRLSYDLPLPPGLPPGTYALAMTPEGQAPLSLGQVDIASTATWPAAPERLFPDLPLEPDTRYEVRNTSEGTFVSRISYFVSRFGRRSAVDWPNGLTLAAAVPADDTVLPGNNLPLTLYWRVGPQGVDLSDVRYRLEVIGEDGAVLRSQEDRPGAPWLGGVPAGSLLREDTGLYIRPDTRPGRFRLRWTLLEGDAPLGDPVTHGRIAVEPWPLATEVPAAPYVVEANFGPAILLHSYYMGVPTNGLLDITLYWQALSAPDRDYLVFIHLVDAAGRIASQVDAVPVAGARPTSGWRAGEVVTDHHLLPVPDDLPPGVYQINAGLYNPDDGTRPPVTVGGAAQPDDQLRLAQDLELPWGEP